MCLKIVNSMIWVLFLLFPSLVMLFCGCLDTFIITIVPAILSAQKCYYTEQKPSNFSSILSGENHLIFMETSYVISSKVLTRLPINILAGYFISKLGSEYVIVLGLLIYGATLIMYVFSNGCINFIISRIIEGVSSSFTLTACYSFLSSAFITRNGKSNAMAFANFFYYCGVCCGPYFGGYLYSNYGHDSTFLFIIPIHLFLSVVSIINVISWKKHVEDVLFKNNIQIKPRLIMMEKNFFHIFKILLNPYVLIICFGVAICNGTTSALSTVLPHWMSINFFTNKEEQGLVWIFGGIIYGISELVSVVIHKFKSEQSYLCPLVGLLLISFSILTISFHVKWAFLCLNMIFIFFGIGLVEYFLFPLMSQMCNVLFDRKSESIAATLLTTSNCLGYFFGALLSGLLTQIMGFRTTCMIFGSLVGLFAPVTIFLSNYMAKEYNWQIINPLIAEEAKDSFLLSTKSKL